MIHTKKKKSSKSFSKLSSKSSSKSSRTKKNNDIKQNDIKQNDIKQNDIDKKELDIATLTKIYKDITKKWKPNTFENLLEFIFNYYLLLKGQRHMFQLYANKKEYAIIEDNILAKFKINFIKKMSNNDYFYNRLIFYNPKKFNIKSLDTTFGYKFAKQLGNFYTCATDEDFGKHYTRVVISIAPYNLLTKKVVEGKNSNIGNRIELYAQMCKYNDINKKNMNNIMKIFENIQTILKELDSRLRLQISINYNDKLIKSS